MNCPKCNQEMMIKKQGVSSDSSNGKEYNRVIYWCEKDDVWLNLEIPKEG